MGKENCVVVDGSAGEGGGQLLRASLALSMALGRPFRMVNIRAGRPKPGLKRQHLTCLRAAQSVCGAEVEGAGINSTEIFFCPGLLRPGQYNFDIGSGGSCTLVLQALLPPLLTASGPSRVTVSGGTHVPFAPPFEFMRDTLFPWLIKMGPRLEADLERIGFMQIGGGRVTVDIDPVEALSPLSAEECGDFIGAEGYIMAYNLNFDIAERERAALRAGKFKDLGLIDEKLSIDAKSHTAEGPGNAVLLTVKRESGATVCAGIGQRGLAAESVAKKAAGRALDFLSAQVPVEAHLADQLLIPMALAGGGTFITEKPSRHTLTCMELLPLFMDIEASACRLGGKAWRIDLIK